MLRLSLIHIYKAAQSYEITAEDYVKQADSGRLDRSKSTENSRTILGLTAAGYNAAAVAGVDLTSGLSDICLLYTSRCV